ncbi:MAG: hypothetical protein HYY93_09540 [Planctomycetes bacterium]|nr:hypothetical protein [Planctomycetota bacterium]
MSIRPAMMAATAALLLAVFPGGPRPLRADDKETPAERETRRVAEFLTHSKEKVEVQSGYHVKGSFGLTVTGAGGTREKIDFTGIVRASSVTQFSLRVPEMNPREDLAAYKSFGSGVIRVDDKMGWVEFERLPSPTLASLVITPPEVYNLIWNCTEQAAVSSATEKIAGHVCHHFSLSLSGESIQALSTRFLSENGREAISGQQSGAQAGLWIDDEGLVYKIALQVTMTFLLPPESGDSEGQGDSPNPGIGGISSGRPGEAPPKPGGVVVRVYDVRIDVSDYGEGVDFNIPPEVERRLR